MKFSIMFWNVENFGRNLEGDQPDPHTFAERVNQVANHIHGLTPDLFCLSEIRDKVAMRSLLMNKLIEYDFAITDGAQGIELLAGWRHGKFQQVLFTQRREFKVDNPWLRPGSLASVKFGGEFFNFLFLHTDSGRKRTDYNNRQEMIEKIWSLKQVLDNISNGNSKFVAMGDLNTMGRKKSGTLPAVTAESEITDLMEDAQANGMRLLSKTHSKTWRKGPSQPNFDSNLDHALATANVSFEPLQNATSSGPAEVSVDGWNHLVGNERDDFTLNISDHCSIFCKVI